MTQLVTLKRQGEGFYSVHLDGNRLSRFSVWDRRRSAKRRRGWLLRIDRSVLGGGPHEEIFPTLKALREWCERQLVGGDGAETRP